MSDNSTTRLIDAYFEEAEAPLHLASQFQSPQKNFHATEKVEIDIVRDDESIAVAVQSIKAGARHNEDDLYQNKAFTPPVLRETIGLSVFDLGNRRPGVDPYTDPDFNANATVEAFRKMRKLERKCRRTVEMMCSMVLQTGEIILVDEDGNAIYAIDYGMRSDHQRNALVTWNEDGSAGNPLRDLEEMAIVVRRNGKKQPKKLEFGTVAWRTFKANALVRAAFDKTVLNIAELNPANRDDGATFQGYIWIGHYRFEMWTYDGFYKHPQTGEQTPYIDDDNVIMTCGSSTRLDLSYGAIPRFPADDRAMSYLPTRMSNQELGLDINPYAWFSENRSALILEAAARPLAIPTAIDTYAVLSRTQA